MTEHLILQHNYQFEHNLTDQNLIVPEKGLYSAVIKTAVKDLHTPDSYQHFFSAIDYFFEDGEVFDEHITVFFEDLSTKDAYKLRMLRGIAQELYAYNKNILKIYPNIKNYIDN